MVMEVKLLQSSKALYPIVFTEFGIEMDDRFVQWAKACLSIFVTEFEIMTVFNCEHPQKAPSPIVVTEPGIVMVVKGQRRKAYISRLVTEVGMEMAVKGQSAKAFPKLFKLLGRVTLVMGHPEKAPFLMVVTELGISIERRLPQA